MMDSTDSQNNKPKFCIDCGTAYVPGQKFCGDCGKKLDLKSIESPSTSPEISRENDSDLYDDDENRNELNKEIQWLLSNTKVPFSQREAELAKLNLKYYRKKKITDPIIDELYTEISDLYEKINQLHELNGHKTPKNWTSTDQNSRLKLLESLLSNYVRLSNKCGDKIFTEDYLSIFGVSDLRTEVELDIAYAHMDSSRFEEAKKILEGFNFWDMDDPLEPTDTTVRGLVAAMHNYSLMSGLSATKTVDDMWAMFTALRILTALPDNEDAQSFINQMYTLDGSGKLLETYPENMEKNWPPRWTKPDGKMTSL